MQHPVCIATGPPPPRPLAQATSGWRKASSCWCSPSTCCSRPWHELLPSYAATPSLVRDIGVCLSWRVAPPAAQRLSSLLWGQPLGPCTGSVAHTPSCAGPHAVFMQSAAHLSRGPQLHRLTCTHVPCTTCMVPTLAQTGVEPATAGPAEAGMISSMCADLLHALCRPGHPHTAAACTAAGRRGQRLVAADLPPLAASLGGVTKLSSWHLYPVNSVTCWPRVPWHGLTPAACMIISPGHRQSRPAVSGHTLHPNCKLCCSRTAEHPIACMSDCVLLGRSCAVKFRYLEGLGIAQAQHLAPVAALPCSVLNSGPSPLVLVKP